jgi:acyl-CoA thioester hydrolase
MKIHGHKPIPADMRARSSGGMPPAAMARLAIRVYYEDTDAAGIVYYANYLRFIERGRTEFLRALGHDQNVLMQEGIAFAVRSVSVEFLKPAKLDDLLAVETGVASLGRAQLTFAQRILRGTELLLDAEIRVVCIDPVRGKPVGMPEDIHERMSSLMGPSG